VNKISIEDYKMQVDLLAKFMSGKLTSVLAEISQKMQDAANEEKFELAAQLRDQLALLTKLQQQQFLDKLNNKRLHILGILQEADKVCITLVNIEQGKVVDDKHWFVTKDGSELIDILEAFLSHYYLAEPRTIWPEEVILPKEVKVSGSLLISIAQKAERQIKWITEAIADNAKWQKLALMNARQKLQMNLQSKQQFVKRFEALAKWLDIPEIKRIECFDISHHQGEATVASCVVFDKSGALKSAYRRYNIEGITGGDDYAAIAQAVTRRVESGIEANNLPDVMIIDGGKGQIKKAEDVLMQYNQQHNIKLLSLGKGIERISGKEDIFQGFDNEVYHLPEHDLAFLLLRQIRDAAHDFAIKAQRKKLAKRHTESVLESIEGVGSKRRQALLRHFGGWQELSRASIDEIAKVKGISPKLADHIWHVFR
jgi:excinuclease ABC subunit C